jgi:hypothetical protein
MRRIQHLFVMLTVVTVALVSATTAWGYFSTSGTGTGSATVATLAAPANVVAANSAGSSTVHVSWDAVLPPAGTLDGYYVERFVGTTPTFACGTSASAPTSVTNCDDANVAAGTYTYKVTAVFRSWTAVSAPSDAVTVAPDSTPPTLAVAFPHPQGYNAAAWNAGTGACTNAICGTAADAGTGVATVQVSIRRATGDYWNGTAFASTTEVLHAATGTTSWTFPFSAANFSAEGTYTIRVVVTDGASFATSESVIITYDNTPPINSVTLANNPTNAALVGQTLYYRGNATGSFAFVDTVTDAASTPRSVNYPAIAASGWTHADETVNAPAGGPFTSSTFDWTSSPGNPGTYTITADDLVGNESSAPIVFTDDSTAPAIADVRIAPALNTTTSGFIRAGGQYYVYANVTDTGSGIAGVTANVGSITSGSNNVTLAPATYAAFATTYNYRSEILVADTTLAAGVVPYAVSATDRVGNIGASAPNVTVDNTEPTVSFTFPAAGGLYSATTWAAGCTTAGVCGSAADAPPNNSGVRDVRLRVSRDSDTMYWNGSAWQAAPTWLTVSGTTTWSQALPASALTNGTYTLNAQSFDQAGNSSTPVTNRTFTYDSTAPALASVTSNGGSTPGRMQNGDTLVLTFDEAINAASVPTTVTVTEARAGQSTLTIPGVIATASINNSYLSGNNTSATATGTVTVSADGLTVTVTLSNVTGAGLATGSGSVTIAPASTLADRAGNPVAATTRSLTRLF